MKIDFKEAWKEENIILNKKLLTFLKYCQAQVQVQGLSQISNKGRIHSKKKKLWIFTTGWGGHPKILTFSQLFYFFLVCSNSSISAIKNFFEGGKGTPWPIYFENLDNFQLNIDFFLSILGFQGRIFLNLHKMFFGSWS